MEQKMRNNFDLSLYICKKVKEKIILSGKLDDPLWKSAKIVSLHDAITGEHGRFSTNVRILYDDLYLYVGFACEDDYIWGTVMERDGPIWDEECVEVFLNPANVAHQYYEINVSPKNIIYDSVILNNRTPDKPQAQFIGFPQWDAEALQTAVQVVGELDKPGGARQWTAEFAIPFSALFGAKNNPPQNGDVWRANFYRIDSPQKGNREHYAWSPTEKAEFHLPWRFGFLRFE